MVKIQKWKFMATNIFLTWGTCTTYAFFVVNLLEVLKLLFLFGCVVPICDKEHNLETVFHFCLLLTLTASGNLF